MKALVIAGTHSGSGKTTISLGLMAALRRRGLKIAPFKVGPDFIDPGHHTQVTGIQSRNLDGWMLSRAYNMENFYRGSADADIVVIEGVMGLYDGYDGRSEAGSTAQMAKWLGAPVLLVVDARSMARSAAAVVQGFERFDPDLAFTGVIFNRLGSARHLSYLTDALVGHVEMPCLGGVMRTEAIALPERHLGLVTQEDHGFTDSFLNELADLIEKSLDIDRLFDLLPVIQALPQSKTSHPQPTGPVRIAVARDRAFCFYYHENLELLTQNNARLIFFSPMKKNALPEDIDGIYFGGGYPELHAAELAANTALREKIKSLSRAGMPIYGECGGLMYLGEVVSDQNGQRHPMTGCLPISFRMLPRLKRLGYRETTLRGDTLLGKAGTIIRGHEFHYSEIIDEQPPAALSTRYAVTDRTGSGSTAEGFQKDQTLGSYIHLHWGSCPEAARAFTNACRHYKTKRN